VKDGKRELVIGRATRERAALQLVHLREQKPDEKFEIEDTPTYQAWKKEVNEHFTEEIDELKFAASSAYDLAIQENQSRKRSRQTLHLLVSSCRRGTTHQTPKPNRMHVYANA
jgi:hypothetical protein